MINLAILAIALAILLGITIAFLMYFSTAHVLLKLIVFPIILATGVIVYDYYIEFLGQPVMEKPQGEYKYHHHIISGDDTIVIWLEDIQGAHRLYKFPYDREDAKDLEEAREGKENSQEGQQIVKFGDQNIDPDHDDGDWIIKTDNPVKPPIENE